MGQRPQTRLRPASLSTKPRLWELLKACLAELATTTGGPPATDPDGSFTYPYFDAYWQEPGRHPFGIWFGSSLAGLCLLRDVGGGRWQVAECYVAPAFRRQGIGLAAVTQAAAWCAARGTQVLEARVHRRNPPARAFWERAAFAAAATEGDYAVLERRTAPA